MMTTKTTKRLSILATALAAACGGVSSEFGDSEDDATASAPAKFFTIEHDNRKCAYPACGGYFITPLKTHARAYVQKLDLARSGLAVDERDLVLNAPEEEIVVQGKLNKAQTILKVTAAYRGLPGIVPGGRDAFYTVRDESKTMACVRAPCDNKIATNAVYGTSQRYASHKLDRTMKPLVDSSWLTERIVTGLALVTAKVMSKKAADGTTEAVLDVSQTFVKLPERASCPAYKLMACATGEVRAFERDANRCLVPAPCVAQSACNQKPVSCAEGYTMQSWTRAEDGCLAHACDPTWSVQTDAE